MLRIDPETTLGLLLRLGGLASFLILCASITGALLVAAIGVVRGNARLSRRAAMVGAALLGTYGALLLAGPLLLGRRTLAPGQELAFCGVDCHLHLTTTHVARNGGVDVTTAPLAVAAGADVLVAGSAIFNNIESVTIAMERLQAAARR